MPLGGSTTALLLKRMVPSLGLSSPLISLSSVDFPQPDGPTIDRKLRLSISQVKLLNTARLRPLDLNVLLTPRN